MSAYIVYELRRPCGTTFYVGKGRPNRPYAHVRTARKGERSHKANVIRKIESEGFEVVIAVVFETDDEDAAFVEERRLIAEHRAAGIALTNATDGGEGISGCVRSAEARANIGAAQRGKTLSAAHREKLRVASLGKRHTAEAKEKCRIANLGKRHTAETREKCRIAKLGTTLSAEARAKVSAAQRGRTRPPFSAEWREKIRAANLGKVRGPHSAEWREKISAAQRGRTFSDEHREKLRIAQLGKTCGPLNAEHRAKLSAAKLGKSQGPLSAEHRAKISASLLRSSAMKSTPDPPGIIYRVLNTIGEAVNETTSYATACRWLRGRKNWTIERSDDAATKGERS